MSADSQNFAKNAPDEFPVWQTTLLAQTGLAKKDFYRLRALHCVKGVDYRIGRLNHVEFSLAGARKMRALALGQKTARGAAPVAPGATLDVKSVEGPRRAQLLIPEPVKREDVALQVVKIWPLNRQRLQARLMEDGPRHKKGELVVVRVRDNQRHKPGTAITGRHVEGNIYALSKI